MSRFRFALLTLAIGLAVGSCDKASRVAAPASVAPVADSPAQAVRVLEWAFANRNSDVLEGLLSADFRHVTAALDSAGNGNAEVWDRSRFMNSIHVLFHGDGTGTAPARQVSFVLDRNLTSFPDPRPGHDASAHRTIRTSLDLKVEHADQSVTEVTGFLLFYLTSGDSASLPEGAAGEPPANSNARWWITRIEDETLPNSGFAANGGSRWSFSEVLRVYWRPR